MKAFLKPRSIFQLTVVGFLAVVTPLVIGLILVAQQLESLSRDSQETIAESAEAMRIGRSLIELASGMERSARQYAVLGDEELLEIYSDRRRAFRTALNQFDQMGLSEEVRSLADSLAERESEAYTQLQQEVTTASLAFFPAIVDQSQELDRLLDSWVDDRILVLAEQAEGTKSSLQTLALVLIVLTVLMSVTFIQLITRPLKQVDRAIHQLGSGGLEREVAIQGPQDLQELGTRLDWLRRRLISLEQQRTRFMQQISHELKTPLAAIQEGAALLDDGVVGSLNQKQAELTAILRENCRRLLELIENLLRHRADEIGSVNAAASQIRLDKLVDRVIENQQLIAQSSRVSIETRCGKISVHANPEHMKIVVENLLSNAIRFSPEMGVVHVDLRLDGDEAVLSISDQGPGIPREDREKIFEAFYQGPPADRAKPTGTGLGLAIAQEYLQMNRGSIEVVDTYKGACFEVRLPRGEEE